MMGKGRGCSFFPQALRDLVTAGTRAWQDGDLEAQEEAKTTWQVVAKAFWNKTAADSEELKANRPKTLFRTETCEWICATCHMLLIATYIMLPSPKLWYPPPNCKSEISHLGV